MSQDYSSIFAGIPKDQRKFLALIDGTLHISKAMGSDMSRLSDLLARLRKSGIGGPPVYHEPAAFERDFLSRSILALADVTDDNKVQAAAKDLIATAFRKGASDIHITELGNYASVKMRIKGLLTEIEELEAEVGERLIKVYFDSFATTKGLTTFTNLVRMDSRIIRRDVLPQAVHSVRLHSEPIQLPSSERNDGMGSFLAMRLLYDTIKAEGSLEERLGKLGFLAHQMKTIRNLTHRGGISIISGPTGHGKSTVLKHIMESMIRDIPTRAYFSVEDPPEYPIRGMAQILVNTNKGETSDFGVRGQLYTDAIAGSLRSDPDVIMIGEIRYPQAALAAIYAAQTGHSVWATVHANDGFGIVTRLESLLRDAGVSNPLEMLCQSNVLTGLCHQRLVATLCPACKKQYGGMDKDEQLAAVHEELYDKLAALRGFGSQKDFDTMCVRGSGCEDCSGSGLSTMTVVAEAIEITPEVLSVMKRKGTDEARKIWLTKPGAGASRTYMEHAIQLIREGVLDPNIVEDRIGTLSNSYAESA
jgi:type II secretory ATPase GspE/PulE/Tfp pilus assembly ATPase PilB-like protein